MHKFILVSLIALAILPSVFAGVDIRITPISTNVKPGEMASYYIYLNNTDMWSKTATIYLLTPNLYGIEPTYFVQLPGNSQTELTLKIVTPIDATSQRYYEDVFFSFSDFSKTTQKVSYDIRSPELYLNLTSFEVEEYISSTENFLASIQIENNYYERIKSVQLIINAYDSQGNSIYYTLRDIELSEGIKNYEVILNIGQELPNQEIKIDASLKWAEMELGTKSATTQIGQSESEDSSLHLSMEETKNSIIISNEGNIQSNAFLHEKELNIFVAFLIKSATVPYTLTSSSIIYEVPSLEPGQSIELKYELDYLLPILLILLAAIFIYFSAIRTVSVKKELKEIKPMHNSLQFKIVLNVSNPTNKKINHLRIREFLPSLISEVFGFGTIEGEIKPLGRQKYVQWEIKNLKPKENVILSYRAKTKVGLIGDLVLDNSRAEILNEKGKIIKKIQTKKIILTIGQKKQAKKSEKK